MAARGELNPSDDLLEQIRAEIELTRISYEHQLHVTRHVIERNEAAFREVSETLASFRDQLIERMDAQTEAIFRLIDRFENGSAGPATT